MTFTPASDLGRALGIALGTTSYLSLSGLADGAAVRFDNDGSFEPLNAILDMTLPAGAQTGAGNPYALSGTQVRLTYGFDIYLPYYTQYYSQLDTDQAGLARNASYFVKAFAAGEVIGAAALFTDGPRVMFEYRTDCTYDYGSYQFECTVSYPGEFLNDGSVQYAGLRLDIGGMNHYGWLAIRHTGPYASDFDLVAWGYETTANTPVAAGAPTPSTLAGLALGAAAFMGRTRRD